MNLVDKSIVWAFLAVWGAGFSPAFADERPRTERFYLTPSAGYYGTVRLGGLIPLSNTADVPDVKILLEPSGPEGGVSLGYTLGRRFELQLAASASRARIMDDVGIGFAGVPLGKKKISDAVFWNLGVRLLYSLNIGKISPYLAAGLEAAILDTREIGARTRPAFELGAGLNIRISRRLRAGFEVRDAVSFFRYFEDFRIDYPTVYSAEVRGVQHRLGARLILGYLI